MGSAEDEHAAPFERPLPHRRLLHGPRLLPRAVRGAGLDVPQQFQERPLVDDGHPVLACAACLGRAGAGIVRHQQARVAAHGRHHVQPSGHRPLGEPLAQRLGLAGDGDLHPLDEPVAEPARTPVGAPGLGNPGPEVLLRRARHERQRETEPARLLERSAQHASERPDVLQRVVGLGGLDPVVRGQRPELQVAGRRGEPAVQRQRAQPPFDRKPDVRALELLREEAVVEGGVVGDEHPAAEHFRDAPGHVLELGRPFQPLGRQPVNVNRPGIASRVEQGGILPARPPVASDRYNGEGQNPMLNGSEPRSLHVHQRPLIPEHGGRLIPALQFERTIRRPCPHADTSPPTWCDHRLARSTMGRGPPAAPRFRRPLAYARRTFGQPGELAILVVASNADQADDTALTNFTAQAVAVPTRGGLLMACSYRHQPHRRRKREDARPAVVSLSAALGHTSQLASAIGSGRVARTHGGFTAADASAHRR